MWPSNGSLYSHLKLFKSNDVEMIMEYSINWKERKCNKILLVPNLIFRCLKECVKTKNRNMSRILALDRCYG